MGTVCPCVLKPSQFAFLIQQIATEISHINQSSLVAVGRGGVLQRGLETKKFENHGTTLFLWGFKGRDPTYLWHRIYYQ